MIQGTSLLFFKFEISRLANPAIKTLTIQSDSISRLVFGVFKMADFISSRYLGK